MQGLAAEIQQVWTVKKRINLTTDSLSHRLRTLLVFYGEEGHVLSNVRVATVKQILNQVDFIFQDSGCQQVLFDADTVDPDTQQSVVLFWDRCLQ